MKICVPKGRIRAHETEKSQDDVQRRKRKRGRFTNAPSLAEYSNINLILDKLDDMEDHIQRHTNCCKRLHDLEKALATAFKCTICLNIFHQMVSNLQVAASVLLLALNVPKNGIKEAIPAHSAEARKEAARGNGHVDLKGF